MKRRLQVGYYWSFAAGVCRDEHEQMAYSRALLAPLRATLLVE
jgi:hypothetical protein